MKKLYVPYFCVSSKELLVTHFLITEAQHFPPKSETTIRVAPTVPHVAKEPGGTIPVCVPISMVFTYTAHTLLHGKA